MSQNSENHGGKKDVLNFAVKCVKRASAQQNTTCSGKTVRTNIIHLAEGLSKKIEKKGECVLVSSSMKIEIS